MANNVMALLKEKLTLADGPASTEIHHRKGRIGEMLNNTKYWMAVCREAHAEIHNNPKEAYSKGFLLTKEDRDE